MGVVESAIGSVLRANERVIERREPRSDGPLDPDRFGWVPRVDAGFASVRAELESALAAGLRLPKTEDVMGAELGEEGIWSTYILCSFGTWLPFNCERFPATTALVRTVPGLRIAGFSVLEAGAHIPRHRGPSKAVRYHLGIIVPGAEGDCRLAVGSTVNPWREGESILFDDAVEHEAWNDSDRDRYVLFIESLWPLPRHLDVLNRAAQRTLAVAARDVPARAEELDAALNP